jgi:uncharacterized membrane protein YdjX (TVP38/TMEM64 family)
MFTYRNIAKGLLTLLLFVAFGLLLNQLLASSQFNENWIDHQVKNHGAMGIFYFIGLCALTTACGLPRQLAAFLGGYGFGVLSGTLLATLGATFGCVISFYFARIIARRFIHRKYGHRIQRINKFLLPNTFIKTIIIRLLPIGSNLITNLIAGVTHAKARFFVSGSFVGYLPQMIIFALAGSGVEVQSAWKISLSVILFLISTVLSAKLYRQYKIDKRTQESLTVS